MTVPAVQQKVVTDPGVNLSMVDSGVPPDTWHDVTVAQALAAHKPMVLYFGEPGYCPSKTCGPTIAILKQLCTQYCAQFSFQHIEDDIPPGPAFVQPNALPEQPGVPRVRAAQRPLGVLREQRGRGDRPVRGPGHARRAAGRGGRHAGRAVSRPSRSAPDRVTGA